MLLEVGFRLVAIPCKINFFKFKGDIHRGEFSGKY